MLRLGHPVQNRLRRRNLSARWERRSVNHHNRQTQRPRGVDFGVCANTACIFAHHDVDGMLFEQSNVTGHIEGTARDNDTVMRQAGLLDWGIDQTQHIVVLGLGGKVLDMHTAQRQHDAPRRTAQRLNRARDVGHMGPRVPSLSRPRRARQSEQLNACLGAGVIGVPAHLCGKRVRGIHHMSDVMLAKISHKARHAAKAADALRDRLHLGAVHAARITEGRRNPGIRHCPRQSAGFGCSAQNKEMCRHG